MTALREMEIDWSKAACRGAPPSIFITDGDDDDDPYYPPPEAMEYCQRCPIRSECLTHAMARDEVGVWGGTSRYQRRQLARKSTRAKCPGCYSEDLIEEGAIELCLSCGMSWSL